MLWQYTRTDTKILLVATLLVFSGYALVFAQGVRMAREGMMAQTIGVFASVPDNGVNSYNEALDARARALDARELALKASAESSDTRTLYAIAVIGISLLGLILLNFYLDHRRRVSLAS